MKPAKWRATADEDGNYCFAWRYDAAAERRSGRITNDGLRSCATPAGRLSSRFRGWSGYPSAAAISINLANGAMGQQRTSHLVLDRRLDATVRRKIGPSKSSPFERPPLLGRHQSASSLGQSPVRPKSPCQQATVVLALRCRAQCG